MTGIHQRFSALQLIEKRFVEIFHFSKFIMQIKVNVLETKNKLRQRHQIFFYITGWRLD